MGWNIDPATPLDYSTFCSGYEDNPPEAAYIFAEGRDDYPDNVVAWIDTDLPESTQEHFCRLFAAAPDLLACCQELLARAERSYKPLEKLTGRDEAALDAGIVRARAAIAKAIGKTPQSSPDPSKVKEQS